MKERQPSEYEKYLNSRFSTLLHFWQRNPDDPRAIGMMKGAISEVSNLAFGISFKVTGEILNDSEAGRATTSRDLRKFAKFDGKDFVFNFGPKTRKGAEYLLTPMIKMEQPHLVLWGKHEGMIGIFRPHEIKSLEVKAY